MEEYLAKAQQPLNDRRLVQVPFQSDSSGQYMLVQSLAIDVLSAFAATIAVAPVVTIVDVAVTQASFGVTTVLASTQSSTRNLFLRPHQFIFSRPFAVVFLLYFSTFSVANSTDTLSKTYGLPTTLKLATTTAVNSALSLYKDSQFARVFVPAATRPIVHRTPLRPAVLGPWLIRDFITIAATFGLPPLLSSKLSLPMGISQLLAPMISQPFVAPLHLVGLDAYNQPEKVTLWGRWSRVRQVWMSVSLAKMFRVLPGLGVGSLLNSNFKQKLSI